MRGTLKMNAKKTLSDSVMYAAFLESIQKYDDFSKVEWSEKLGPFYQEVVSYIGSIEISDFFTNVGQELNSLNEQKNCIIQLFSWEDAKVCAKSLETENWVRNTSSLLWSLSATNQLGEYISDAYSFWLRHTKLTNLPSGIDKRAFFKDMKMVMAELITKEFHDITLFRDKWFWYSQGRWPCGIRLDGTLIIY